MTVTGKVLASFMDEHARSIRHQQLADALLQSHLAQGCLDPLGAYLFSLFLQTAGPLF